MFLYHTGNFVFEIADFLFSGLYFSFNPFSLLAFENACGFGKLRSQLRQFCVLYLRIRARWDALSSFPSERES